MKTPEASFNITVRLGEREYVCHVEAEAREGAMQYHVRREGQPELVLYYDDANWVDASTNTTSPFIRTIGESIENY